MSSSTPSYTMPTTPSSAIRPPLGEINSNTKAPASEPKKGEHTRVDNSLSEPVVTEEASSDALHIKTPNRVHTSKDSESGSSTEFFTPDSGGSRFSFGPDNKSQLPVKSETEDRSQHEVKPNVSKEQKQEHQETFTCTPESNWSQSTSPPLAFTRGNERGTSPPPEQSTDASAERSIDNGRSSADSVEEREGKYSTERSHTLGDNELRKTTCTKNLFHKDIGEETGNCTTRSPSQKADQPSQSEGNSNENDVWTSDDEGVYQTPAPRRRRLPTQSRKETRVLQTANNRIDESNTRDEENSEDEVESRRSCVNLTTIKKTIRTKKYLDSSTKKDEEEDDISDFIVTDNQGEGTDSCPVAEDDLPGEFDQLSINSSEDSEGSPDKTSVASPVGGRPTIERGSTAFVDGGSSDDEDVLDSGTKGRKTSEANDQVLRLLDSAGYNWSTMQHRFPQQSAKKQREKLVEPLYTLFNKTVFDKQLPVSSQDVVQWSGRLRTTAGVTYTKRIPGTATGREFHIVLSTKVLDRPFRVACTLLHEMCHAAAWVIDGNRKPPHGAVWKAWAKKASNAYPVFSVSRLHTYEVHYKYQYSCENTNCSFTQGRHSKSIDTETSACPVCGGKLQLSSSGDTQGGTTANNPNKFSVFVQKHYNRIKQGDATCSVRQNLGKQFMEGGATPLSHKQTMQELSKLWRQEKDKTRDQALSADAES